jgi:hypothetical protein
MISSQSKSILLDELFSGAIPPLELLAIENCLFSHVQVLTEYALSELSLSVFRERLLGLPQGDFSAYQRGRQGDVRITRVSFVSCSSRMM